MSDVIVASLVYLTPMLLVWGVYSRRRGRRQARAIIVLREAEQTGMTEPASLHPVVDPALCVGCGSCVAACPEGEVLGLINGKATLIQPASCIGHGACQTACPRDALTLVLGTERRGVQIPAVGPDFQTNVQGLFVAGELGGMGLIRNAIEQGRQAMDSIAALPRAGHDRDIDVLIVGAGPAGIAASLRARELGLRAITVDQESLGGTVAHYPRGKIVMTAPVDLPMYGKVQLRETTKEALLELWTDVVGRIGIEVRCQQRVTAVERHPDGFVVQTEDGRYESPAVLLAIGRRGTPRKLGVPGEEHEKVVYRLVDPEQYRGRRVLVVGGGDSALEAAIALSEEPDTEVALCYRSDAFSRAKVKNRKRLSNAAEQGKLQVFLSSTPREIKPDSVLLETPNGEKLLANDTMIVCAGGILPTAFLKSVGVEVETHHGRV